MRRFLVSSVLLSLLACRGGAATLPELFQKAKNQFRLGAYTEALVTLETLSLESKKPGNAIGGTSLVRGIVFYRGSCLAALGRREEAREQFEQFLAFQPNARLDPSAYPKKVIDAFEETRRSLDIRREPTGDAGNLAKSYQAFSATAAPAKPTPLEQWADGPVRFLLTADERRHFLGLSDPASRSEFITNFWRTRDPKPETPENELREELEKRMAFADSHFTESETPGSLTDRGMVFILLGPPNYVGRRPLNTGDDTADPGGLSRYSHGDVIIAAKSGGTTADRANRIDQVTGPSVSVRDAAAKSSVETWRYSRELLPAGLPFQQVDFAFVTKQGYGKNVLQRDPDPLASLERAKEAIRRGAL